MSLPVVLRPEARADLEEAHSYYAQKPVAGLADDFVAKVDAVLGLIADFPALYPVLASNERAVKLRRFPYVLYDPAHSDRVEVIAILHGSRHPRAWKRRT